MDRRRLIVSFGAFGAAPLPIKHVDVAAHSGIPATPIASSETGEFQLDGLDGVQRGVGRSWTLADPGFGDILAGNLLSLLVTAAEFDTSDHASQAIAATVAHFPGDLAAGMEASGGYTTTDVSIGRMGDERAGLAIELSFPEEEDEFQSASMGLLLVRKDRFLQLSVGFALMGAVSQVVPILEDTDARWPSDDLRDMLPDLSDLPAGFALDEERTF